MTTFKVGDVVVLTESIRGTIMQNKTGVVKNIDSQSIIGVEFDNVFIGGHNIGGHGKDGRCLYLSPDSLTKMAPIQDILRSLNTVQFNGAVG